MPKRRSGRLPWKPLGPPLTANERARVANAARALLGWQEHLRAWPRLVRLPDATPFVSLYASGRLVGCFGSTEGDPGERLARAFLNALADPRYGGVHPDERQSLTISVSYLRLPASRELDAVERALELGTHGLAAVASPRTAALLLPAVAVDEGLDAPTLLRVLAEKLGLAASELSRASLFTFETDTVVARRNERASRRREAPVDMAARWLAAQVDSAGHIRFGIDARTGVAHDRGEFMHGRAAVVIQALAAHGGYPAKVARARRWLLAEIRAALRDRRHSTWPSDRAAAAGAVALAVLAGVPLENELVGLASAESLAQNPWHAAQVVAALGERAPRSHFQACIANLDAEPWAPWTAVAANVLGDAAVARRVEDVLAASIRAEPPYRGAAQVTPIPEVALTAVAVEALARSSRPPVRNACKRAAAFLTSMQLVPERIPAPLDPEMAQGAFPLSPIANDLRSDVTAHALLALLSQRGALRSGERSR